jgi:cytochrome bd ubiquinol oxidase subunit II
MELVLIWSILLGLAIILYVVLDGFVTGVGLLFPTCKNEQEREMMMNSVAPVRDANQTWLVFGGGAVFVAFPLVYGILFSALYIPLLTFIFGLIFRGVALEFRENADHKAPWNRAFFGGSLTATLAQGLTLGGVISGIAVENESFAGAPFDWFNPFSVFIGIALIAGYTLLGSTYLIIKTTGEVQRRAYRQALWSGIFVLGFQAAVTIWTPLHYPSVLTVWFNPPRIYFIWIFPLAGLFAFYRLIKDLGKRREILPFLWTVLLFLAGYLGLVASLYPLALPPSITFREAMAQPETLRFTFWGVLIVLPVVLGYTVYSYAVFRGKVGSEPSTAKDP